MSFLSRHQHQLGLEQTTGDHCASVTSSSTAKAPAGPMLAWGVRSGWGMLCSDQEFGLEPVPRTPSSPATEAATVCHLLGSEGPG